MRSLEVICNVYNTDHPSWYNGLAVCLALVVYFRLWVWVSNFCLPKVEDQTWPKYVETFKISIGRLSARVRSVVKGSQNYIGALRQTQEGQNLWLQPCLKISSSPLKKKSGLHAIKSWTQKSTNMSWTKNKVLYLQIIICVMGEYDFTQIQEFRVE